MRQSQRLRMRDEDLTAICDRTKKKTKPEFQLGRFLCSARIKRNVEAMIRFSGCGGFTSANPNSLITNIQVQISFFSSTSREK